MALVDIKIWSDTYGTEAVARNLHIQSAVEALLVVTPGEAEMLAALLTDAATSARMLADTVRLDSLRFGDMFTIPLLSEPARSMRYVVTNVGNVGLTGVVVSVREDGGITLNHARYTRVIKVSK